MTRQKKGKDIEIQISSNGKRKILVASNCAERVPIKTKLGIGKRKKFLACETFEIIDGNESAPEQPEHEMMPDDGYDDDIPEVSQPPSNIRRFDPRLT